MICSRPLVPLIFTLYRSISSFLPLWRPLATGGIGHHRSTQQELPLPELPVVQGCWKSLVEDMDQIQLKKMDNTRRRSISQFQWCNLWVKWQPGYAVWQHEPPPLSPLKETNHAFYFGGQPPFPSTQLSRTLPCQYWPWSLDNLQVVSTYNLGGRRFTQFRPATKIGTETPPKRKGSVFYKHLSSKLRGFY